MPALIENSPVQPGLLAHIASGFVYGAPGAGSHTLGVEVFQHNGSKPAGQLETDTVVPVLADAGATGAQAETRARALAYLFDPRLRLESTAYVWRLSFRRSRCRGDTNLHAV